MQVLFACEFVTGILSKFKETFALIVDGTKNITKIQYSVYKIEVFSSGTVFAFKTPLIQ